MSVSSYGVLTFDTEPGIFKVAKAVKNALDNNKYVTTNQLGNIVPSSVFMETRIITPYEFLQVIFKDGEDFRQLSIHFPDGEDETNLGDFSELFGRNKLLLSLNRWGRDEKIIKDVLGELRQFGIGCWFLENAGDENEVWRSF